MEKYMLVPEKVEAIEIVQEVRGHGFCPYSTMENLKSNWRVLDLRETENK